MWILQYKTMLSIQKRTILNLCVFENCSRHVRKGYYLEYRSTTHLTHASLAGCKTSCVYPIYAEYIPYVIDRLLLNWNKVNAGQFSCRLCTCCRPQPMWSSCSISPARDLLPVKNCLFMKLLETIDYVIMLFCELSLPKGIKLRVLEKWDWCLICASLEMMSKHGGHFFFNFSRSIGKCS